MVVLGATGRNFGAGMSGGIAYVHDPDGVFPTRVNYEMVVAHRARRHRSRHSCEQRSPRTCDQTDSQVRPALLGDWDDSLGAFTKVMPNDYQTGAGRHRPRRGARGWT